MNELMKRICYNYSIKDMVRGELMKWSIPSTIIEEGHKLVKEDRILKVIPDYDQDRWHAEVLDNATYTVSLDGTAKEADICQCEIWQKKGFCPHTVAVELFMRNHDVLRVMKFNQKKDFVYPENALDEVVSTDQLYSDYMQHLGNENIDGNDAKVQPLKVVFELHDELTTPFSLTVEKLFYLRIKIGITTTYYVSDIAEFFATFRHGGILTLPNRDHTKIWLVKTAFQKTAYEQLVKLSQYHLTQNQWLNTVHVTATKKMRQRLYLDYDIFNGLLDVNQKKTKLIHFYLDEERQHPQVFDDIKPEMFKIEAIPNNQFALSLLGTGQWYQHYQLIYDGQDIYRIEANTHYFQDMLFLMQKFAEKQQTLELKKEELEEFIMMFGGLMLAHCGIAQIELLNQKIQLTDYQATIEMGVKNQQIVIEIIHQYGDYAIADNPLKTALPDKGILVRDLRQESSTESLLLKDGFTQENNEYVKPFKQLSELMAHIEILLTLFPAEWKIDYDKSLEHWHSPQVMSTKIDVKPIRKNRYLTIDFEIDDVEPAEVNRILTAIDRNEDYYALNDGRIINVQEAFTTEQNKMLAQLRKQNKSWHNGDAIPLYQSVLYADALEGQVDFQQFYQDLTKPDRDDYQPSPQLKTELADYQLYAVQWMNTLAKYQLGGLLADEMGLGKTVQTIAFILDYRQQFPDSQILVLAPASVLYNWQHEFKRFSPNLKTAVIDGSISERAALRDTNDIDIWISSYHSYRNDQEVYQAIFFDILVLDEAQAIKNDRSQLYLSLTKQKAGMRIGLSGTPLENNLQEFWALMQIILPGLLPAKKIYNQMAMADIRKVISPFVLRRSKNEVNLSIPQKAIYDRYSNLDSEQKNIYVAYLSDIQSRLENNSGSHFELLSAITRLRQICCHPRLINPEYEGTSGKFEHFKVALERALANGKRILIFSQFTSMLSIINDYLIEKGIDSFIITGQTEKEKRQDKVDSFNAGENSVFLISLRAGGVGINLTGADTIFLYDLWWNPAVEEQAIGRAHRIGQKNEVQVYRFITEGTIEERISELQNEKRDLFDELFNEESQNIRKNLTTEDLRYILGIS